jgi:hypothetical protein
MVKEPVGAMPPPVAFKVVTFTVVAVNVVKVPATAFDPPIITPLIVPPVIAPPVIATLASASDPFPMPLIAVSRTVKLSSRSLNGMLFVSVANVFGIVIGSAILNPCLMTVFEPK